MVLRPLALLLLPLSDQKLACCSRAEPPAPPPIRISKLVVVPQRRRRLKLDTWRTRPNSTGQSWCRRTVEVGGEGPENLGKGIEGVPIYMFTLLINSSLETQGDKIIPTSPRRFTSNKLRDNESVEIGQEECWVKLANFAAHDSPPAPQNITEILA